MKVTLKSFQRIQNSADKLILKRQRYESSKHSLKELNWLPVQARIEYKLISLIHKSLFDEHSPVCLKDLLVRLPTPVRSLRSSLDNTNKLLIPFTKHKTFAERSFSVMGPHLWNGLPKHLRVIDNYDTFKSHLKTYLFAKNLFVDT